MSLGSLTSDIDFSPGRVAFAEASPLLKEDLFQVEYPKGYLIDVGWYAEGDTNGAFTIAIVLEGDWEQPLLKLSTQQEEKLKPLLLQTVSFIREKLGPS